MFPHKVKNGKQMAWTFIHIYFNYDVLWTFDLEVDHVVVYSFN